MKHFLKILAFSTVLIANLTFSQDLLWEKSYGGKQAEYLFDAIPTPDYGFILAGSSISGKTGNKTEANKGDLDYWLWKMNEKGELDWQKSFGGNETDLLQSIAITTDAGFILAGTSASGISSDKKNDCKGNDDIWIVKLNAKGEEMWQTTLGGSGQEKASKILALSDGSFLLAGSSSSYPNENLNAEQLLSSKTTEGYGNLDYWIVKLNKEGKIVWQKSFGGIYRDELQSIVQLNNGTILAGGYSNSPVSGNKTAASYGLGDFWVVALDTNGTEKWQKTWGGTQDDQLTCLIKTQNNGYIIAGNSNSAISESKKKESENGSDFWVIKYNENNEEIWQQTYNYGHNDVLTSVVENQDGSFLIGGYAQSEVESKTPRPLGTPLKEGKTKADTDGINDYIALKIDANGNQLWYKTVGSNGNEVMKKTIETRDGGYLLTGTSNSFPSGGVAESRGGSSKDKTTSLGGNDFWVVKLKDNTKPETEKLLIEAFPNPVSTFTNVVIGFTYLSGEATIYDLAGRQLQQLKLNGSQTQPLDLSNYPIGIYVVEISTNAAKQSIKIIKK